MTQPRVSLNVFSIGLTYSDWVQWCQRHDYQGYCPDFALLYGHMLMATVTLPEDLALIFRLEHPC